MACDNDHCKNGWIRWNGSDYPCSACEAEDRKAREERDRRARGNSRAKHVLDDGRIIWNVGPGQS